MDNDLFGNPEPTDKERAEARGNDLLRSDKPQKPMDFGLFDECATKQIDIQDAIQEVQGEDIGEGKIYIGDEIQAIRDKYDGVDGRRYWHHDGFMIDCAKLWGAELGKDANIHGVFPNKEVLTAEVKGGTYYRITLYCSPKGWWTFGMSYGYPLGGGGFGAHVTDACAFTSRDAVLKFAVCKAISNTKHRIMRDDASDSQIKAGENLIEQLQDMINGQKDLFG